MKDTNCAYAKNSTMQKLHQGPFCMMKAIIETSEPKAVSVTQLCPVLCDPMDCSTPDFPVDHQLLEPIQIHVHHISDAIQTSHPVIPFSSHLQSSQASGSFPMSQFFTSGCQSIGASVSASALPMNIQDWSPLGWTGWISLQSKGLSTVFSKGLSRVFSNTTVQNH